MNRREFLKSAAVTAAGANLISVGCATLSTPLKPASLHVFPGESLLLTGATLLDVDKGRAVPMSHILLRDKTIESVSFGSDKPRADKTIDISGAYIMPGLINNHCHMTLPGAPGISLKMLFTLKRQAERNAEECVRHGVTTVRDMLAPYGSLSSLIASISRGDIVGPRIIRSSAVQVEKGYMAVFKALGGAHTIRTVRTPGEARDAVKKAVEDGADFIKSFLQYTELFIPPVPIPVLTDDELLAIVEESSRQNRVVAVHHTSLEGFRRALAAGVTSFEHMPIDAEIPPADIEAFVAARAGIIPTASVGWALSFRRTGDPLSDDPLIREILDDKKSRLEGLLREYAEEEIARLCMKYHGLYSDPAYFDARHMIPTPEPKIFNATASIGKKNLHALHQAGALIGCGNDGGIPFVFPGMMALEMMFLQHQGIPPMRILQMATINNATILRRADTLGSIAKGKIADLVVLPGNPAQDMAHLNALKMVFLEGRLVYAA